MRPIIDAEAPIVPIADALSALCGHAGGASGVQGIESRAAPADPVQVLAWTLDLAGSIELDAHLASPPRRSAHDQPDASAVQELKELVRERFERLEDSVRRRLGELVEGRSKLWVGDRLFELLSREGALAGRRSRAVPSAARQACEAYGLVVANLLERIRGEARSLRFELGPRISELCEAAARLEGFDALLLRARHRFTSELHARVAPEIARQYAVRLDLAVRELPPGPGLDDIARWSGPAEWVADFHGDVSRLVIGVLQRERATLFGLMDSLAAMANSPDSAASKQGGGQG